MSKPRVTYWTGIWDPPREALSKEVEDLRRGISPSSPVVSFSAGQGSGVGPGRRVLRLSGRRWLAFRLLAALLEPAGDVTHAFGAVDAWHILRALGRRPMILTVAISGRPLDPALYEKVALFAAQTRPLAETLLAAGVPAERVRVVPPGLDLERFRPLPPPGSGPFRLLFASAPADPDDFAPRGVPLLVELARLVPEVEVLLLWREWGDGGILRSAFDRLDPPVNVRLVRRDVPDMRQVLSGVHAVVCPYAPGYGKSAPNSILEGLAAGRPALVTEACDLADLLTESGAGVAGPRTPAGLAEALEAIRRDWPEIARSARDLAERQFDRRFALATYAGIYRELARRSVPAWEASR